MVTPLGTWLADRGWTQAKLALVAEVDRAEVCRAINAERPIPPRLRQYLATHAPEILNAQEKCLAKQRKSLLEAAA